MYSKNPKFILLERPELLFGPKDEGRLGDSQFDLKSEHLKSILKYSDNHKIPVYAHCFEEICNQYNIKQVRYSKEPYSVSQFDETKEWLDEILSNNKSLKEEIDNLENGDIVVVGGAHISTKKTTFTEKIKDQFTRKSSIFENIIEITDDCIKYPLSFLDKVQTYYKKDITVVIDPRITAGQNDMDITKLYEVIDAASINKKMKIKPSKEIHQN